MASLPRILAAAAAIAALPLAGAAWCQSSGDSSAGMSGMWESIPGGPGPGGPGGPGGPPPPGGRPGNGPPPGSPEDDASDLPGPNIEGLDRGDKMTYSIMTPAGKAAFEAMDPHNLPSNNCLSNGLPSLALIPDVQEWSFKGQVLTIHYADFDTVRTIYLDGRKADGPATLLGFSSGVWSDGGLTVITTNLTATPGGLGRNAPGSASRSYVEHYELGADGKSITGTLTVHDPAYLTHDLTMPIHFERAAAGTEIPDVECSVEASRRYLDD